MKYLQALTTVRGAFLLLSSAMLLSLASCGGGGGKGGGGGGAAAVTIKCYLSRVESHLCHCGGQSLVLGR